MRPRRIVASLATTAAFALLLAAPFAAASTPTDVGFSACAGVTATTNWPAGPAPPGCGSPISSSSVFLAPDNTCTPATNTNLGTFMTTQNPLGLWVGIKSPDSCATVPPTRGPLVQGGAFTVTVGQTGACPTTLTIPARTTPFGGPVGGVIFPIGTRRFGTYSVNVDFPDQTTVDPRSGQSMSWIGNHATGTLHVGTTFTENGSKRARRGRQHVCRTDQQQRRRGGRRRARPEQKRKRRSPERHRLLRLRDDQHHGNRQVWETWP
jgi:hypothetical protein